jgi:hypothetical protein
VGSDQGGNSFRLAFELDSISRQRLSKRVQAVGGRVQFVGVIVLPGRNFVLFRHDIVLSSGDIEAILGSRKKPFGRLIDEFLGMTHIDTLWIVGRIYRRLHNPCMIVEAWRSPRRFDGVLWGSVPGSPTGLARPGVLRQPNVNAKASTPGPKNLISNWRSGIGFGCRISW